MSAFLAYPALLIWHGDDELSFASDSASLEALSDSVITEDDRLVDSEGVCWLSENGGQHWQPSGQVMPLEQLVRVFKRIMRSKGSVVWEKSSLKIGPPPSTVWRRSLGINGCQQSDVTLSTKSADEYT
ncbi:DUF4144 family protein [Salinivibrio kushneri]|uniref:DUF4144 family protein n=1 Tax=Salinivibrio kushneri TaxID=1908198 RepID=UPI000987BADF|nr:hypothetical protein BZG11_07030 [Salinivibrio kushneri]OOE53069.1 hypothetical protein BZG10_05670 [Salinivibrio kushneri]OOE61240.1 hypothetical protein BZG18_09210 [Salinivibrio kushneri]